MRGLREIQEIEALVALSRGLVEATQLAEVVTPDTRRLPVLGLRIGASDPSLPTLGMFGGVHGVERIGTWAVLSFLYSLVENLRWDRDLRVRFERCRLVAIPLINPGGMYLGQRCNPRGVDLMRNAPVEPAGQVSFLLGGQRWSRHLPWYRGRRGDPLEPEAQALVDFVEREMFQARCALAVDAHSGFGVDDRLWYPYAHGRQPFPRTTEAIQLARLLERTYPHHRYRVEPQSDSYTTAGDLWDHLFDLHVQQNGLDGPVFLPWTLEMGSWTWVRKNPKQLLSPGGTFNPMVPHRIHRVMRQHLVLFDFFLRAVANREAWASSVPGPTEER